MKVLDLQCANHHAFEGWFASEEAFQEQLQRGQVECPVCDDTAVTKMLRAPRLNLGGARQVPTQQVASTPDVALQNEWMKMVRHVVANTEDVGERFPDEARRIHYGEAQERGIRGQASREQTACLLEEGIVVMPLPVPKGFKGPLQ